MRKILLCVGIAALVISCGNGESGVRKSSGTEVTFRTVSSGSRVATIDNFNIRDFMLYGVQHAGTDQLTPSTVNMYDFAYRQPVVLDGFTTWKVSPKLFWPVNGDNVTFFAYSPAGSRNLGGVTLNTPTEYAELIYTCPSVSVPTGVFQPEDLVIAGKGLQNKTTPGASAVQLKFYHALSRFSIVAKNSLENIVVSIEDIAVMNLKTQGFLKLFEFNDPNQTWYNANYDDWSALPTQWYNLGGPGFYRTFYPSDVPNSNIEVAPNSLNLDGNAANDVYTNIGEPVVVIPQTIAAVPASWGTLDNSLSTNTPSMFGSDDDNYLAIRYSTRRADNGQPFDAARWIFLPINMTAQNASLTPSVSTNGFVMGVSYKFALDFNSSLSSLTPITFSVTVDDWEAVI